MLIVVIALNTYPLIISQDLIVETKRDKLVTRANFISSTLSLSEYLAEDKVKLAMDIHNLSDSERVVVCDATGLALYDSSAVGSISGKYVMSADILSALSGLDSFHCSFTDAEFKSRVSVPVIYGENILGAVYLYEEDGTQAGILDEMSSQLQLLSVVIALALLVLILFFSRALTRRLTTLLDGIRSMRDGEYGNSVQPKGHDELTEIFNEFNHMSERLRDTEELRRTFVSDASHELRTPLSSIRLLMDSIMQTPDIDVDTVREFLGDIGEEIDRLTRIAEKLLVLTRLDGAKQLELKEIDFSNVVDLTLNTLEPIAEEAGIELRRDLAKGIRINADEDGTHQIVFNLVENAIKYNTRGGYVHVILFEREGRCSLIIDDTGIGIPEEHYDRIFERFYRVDKARSRSGKGGTGLGLAIVRRNIENYGGTVKIEPSAAGGTRFTVEFDIVRDAEGVEA